MSPARSGAPASSVPSPHSASVSPTTTCGAARTAWPTAWPTVSARQCPGVSIVGTETPPFAPLTDEDLIDLAVRVRASGANILWVGLGTPNQDYVVRRLAPLLEMPIVPVGAAFDFWSGAVAEAPAFLHGSGLEWIYRLSREPRRLWRRYLIGNPRFVMSAFRHRTT